MNKAKEQAKRKDQADLLSKFRKEFHHSEEDLIYLDGNSLGRLPNRSSHLIEAVVKEQWGTQLIRSWNTDWMDLNKRIGAKIATLIGAKPNEVILTDSTSLNLFKLAYGALKMQGTGRTKIVSDSLNFPSDLYVFQGLIDLFGNRHELFLAQSGDGICVEEKELYSLLDEQTALLSISLVLFKSSFQYPMEAVNREAHRHGIPVLWDLSHAVGAVPVHLNASGADMAVGCTYKYLNGGPGSLAFLYVREDLQNQLENPIWAWFADDKPFDFDLDFKHSKGINRFLTSTTPVLSAAAVEPGIDLMLEAGMDAIRQKSLEQTEFLLDLYDQWLAPLGFMLGSPRDPKSRGSHISLRHPDAYRICQALIHPPVGEPRIIPDFRSPDFIRIGITPVYTSFLDIWRSVERIKGIVESNEYENHSTERLGVT